jgi:16S rRNA (uracil1498-N3)-methyltransferase
MFHHGGIKMTDQTFHLFALLVDGFWEGNEQLLATKLVTNVDVVHRLVKVLRCSLHDKFIFFDRSHHGLVEVVQLSKKDLTLKVLSFQVNQPRVPRLTFFLPLLKKEALEEAVYSLCELGVDEIQLVITQKSRQKLLHDKEFWRLKNIVIAAAEQSKNYMYPELHEPKKLLDTVLQSTVSKNQQNYNVVFDAVGQSFFDLRKQLLSASNLCLLVGPEGGLTEQEVTALVQANYLSCRLTSTTLRAVQAVAVGASLFRL